MLHKLTTMIDGIQQIASDINKMKCSYSVDDLIVD